MRILLWLIAIAVPAFVAGFLLPLYLRSKSLPTLFAILCFLCAVVIGILSALIRIDIEKSKAVIDEMKRFESALEEK